MTEYVETGGLRWGESYWRAANATWPFAKVRISQGRVQLRMKGWGWDLTFDLEKSEHCLLFVGGADSSLSGSNLNIRSLTILRCFGLSDRRLSFGN